MHRNRWARVLALVLLGAVVLLAIGTATAWAQTAPLPVATMPPATGVSQTLTPGTITSLLLNDLAFDQMRHNGQMLGWALYTSLLGVEIGGAVIGMMLKLKQPGETFGHLLAVYAKGVMVLLVIQALPIFFATGALYACNGAAAAINIPTTVDSTVTTVQQVNVAPLPVTAWAVTTQDFQCHDAMQPGTVFLLGFKLWARMMSVHVTLPGTTTNKLSPIYWWQTAANAGSSLALQIVMMFLGVCMVGCTSLMAIELIGIVMELIIVSSLGAALMGFSALRELAGFGRGILHYGAEVIVRLFFFYVFLGIGGAMVITLSNRLSTTATLMDIFLFLMLPIIWAFLIFRMNAYVKAMTSGASQSHFMGEAVEAAKMLAIAAAAAATAGAAAGAGAAGAAGGGAGAGAGGGASSATSAASTGTNTSTIQRQSVSVVGGGGGGGMEGGGGADAPDRPPKGDLLAQDGGDRRRGQQADVPPSGPRVGGTNLADQHLDDAGGGDGASDAPEGGTADDASQPGGGQVPVVSTIHPPAARPPQRRTGGPGGSRMFQGTRSSGSADVTSSNGSGPGSTGSSGSNTSNARDAHQGESVQGIELDPQFEQMAQEAVASGGAFTWSQETVHTEQSQTASDASQSAPAGSSGGGQGSSSFPRGQQPKGGKNMKWTLLNEAMRAAAATAGKVEAPHPAGGAQFDISPPNRH